MCPKLDCLQPCKGLACVVARGVLYTQLAMWLRILQLAFPSVFAVQLAVVSWGLRQPLVECPDMLSMHVGKLRVSGSVQLRLLCFVCGCTERPWHYCVGKSTQGLCFQRLCLLQRL
jgi:hypothetical protein